MAAIAVGIACLNESPSKKEGKFGMCNGVQLGSAKPQ